MRIIIVLVLFLAYCSGHRKGPHPPHGMCPPNNAMDGEAFKNLMKEFGSRFDELSSSLRKQMRSLQKAIEENCSKAPSNPTCPTPNMYPSSCAEATALQRLSGIYNIQLNSLGANSFLVVCDEETQGGGWTVIQRRMDGSIDFFRDWNSYKAGFGNLQTEFFIGLDKLHALTNENGPQELLIEMSDFEGETRYAHYNNFIIGSEEEGYALKELGTYSGDAMDSLTEHVGQKFSTKDVKNDMHPTGCAVAYQGAWWYKNCHQSNLNGLYLGGMYGEDKYAQGIVWFAWHGYYYSLKDVKMMIRPKRS